ncbi:hypothetical protein [Sporomusa aerivorans]|uniref:hypothetical protein n=1 Tax=Sporomusa aerivorans TaxID=204936 RepID=UPI00352A803D
MMVRPIPKHKKVRLKGKPLAKLNLDIHVRDKYICIIKGCGLHVPIGEKFHHEPCGSDKEDRIEKGLLLCYEVHHDGRHKGPDSEAIKQECQEYLRGLYGNG